MDRRTFILNSSALALLAAPGRRLRSAPADFSAWPNGASPLQIGTRVAERFVTATPMPAPLELEREVHYPPVIRYWESCAWYGALTFAHFARDEALSRKLAMRFEPLFGLQANLVPGNSDRYVVNNPIFGVVPLALHMQTGEPRYLALGTTFADRPWGPPPAKLLESLDSDTRQAVERAIEEGRAWETHVLMDGNYWVDDAYLVTVLQIQAFRATGAQIYIDRAATEMLAHLEKLQQPNGLFHHGLNAPFFWGRGNGWVAAGMAELLLDLPDSHPNRARIMARYLEMMATLLRYQGDDGMWRQLIDHPGAWPETSCTGMFTFAFVTGVKNGWLDEQIYAPAARKGWLGLTKYIDEDAQVSEVCAITRKSTDERYYLERRRNVGDLHGQAPILWSAAAFLR